jgi:hypothetical protein
MKRDGLGSGKPALELIEEATHALRVAPAGTIAAYYVGAIPFVIGLLYFWSDMSRSPFAESHLAEASLGVCALFFWMKTWQVLFAHRIRAQLGANSMPSWSMHQACRIFLSQAIIQPSGLFVLPIASFLILPFGWVYAFYQNVTALADAESLQPAQLVKKAWKHAELWPVENQFTLGAVSLFVGSVFLNWFVVSLSIPGVLKMLFGIETVFSRNLFAMLNSTFFAAMFALTYLSVDPILKTIYTLRCFYADSLKSGEDLKANLKQFSVVAAQTILPAVLLVLFVASISSAQEPRPTTSNLDKQIEQVIHQSKYAWRLPRTAVEPPVEQGVISKFVGSAINLVRRTLKSALDWIADWLRRAALNRINQGNPSGFDWITSSLLLYALLAVVIVLLVVVFVRAWHQRRRSATSVQTEAIVSVPDIADENVGADQLPRDGWVSLAHQLLDRGELRLAMRAFYLSSLAQLADRNLVSLAKFKSNREYERELLRRAASIPDVAPTFAANVSTFERIWYGMHDVNPESVQAFAANVQKLSDLSAQPS